MAGHNIIDKRQEKLSDHVGRLLRHSERDGLALPPAQC